MKSLFLCFSLISAISFSLSLFDVDISIKEGKVIGGYFYLVFTFNSITERLVGISYYYFFNFCRDVKPSDIYMSMCILGWRPNPRA